jgi:hypothetical protein
MVDNFEKLNSILEFESEDDFYMLQVMKRRKENPEMDKNSVALKTVYLHRKDQLLELKDDLVELADKKNARIYLNPNRKSFKKCTLACLKEFADRISNENFYKPYKIFDSVAGAAGSKNAIWVIDIDWDEVTEQFGDVERSVFVNDVCEFINSLKPDVENKIKLVNETKNGTHILTSPFNMYDFMQRYKIQVHKNNPTLVYCK